MNTNYLLSIKHPFQYKYIMIILVLSVISIITIAILLKIINNLKLTNDDILKKLSYMQELDIINNERAITDGLYDNIIKADLTNDTLLSNNSKILEQSLTLNSNTKYSSFIREIHDTMIHDDYKAIFIENLDNNILINKFSNGQNQFSFEYKIKLENDTYSWRGINIRLYFSKVTNALQVLLYFKDIQTEKEREFNLLQEASTDFLTGLYNKRATESYIHQVLNDSQDTYRKHALIIIDIDYFKQINDTVGHAAGDIAIRDVANLIKDAFSDEDIVGRIGGDEFLVFKKDCPNIESVTENLSDLNYKVTLIADQLGLIFKPSLSIGISFYPMHAENYTDLLAAADSALYYVKNNGKGDYHIYRED